MRCGCRRPRPQRGPASAWRSRKKLALAGLSFGQIVRIVLSRIEMPWPPLIRTPARPFSVMQPAHEQHSLPSQNTPCMRIPTSRYGSRSRRGRHSGKDTRTAVSSTHCPQTDRRRHDVDPARSRLLRRWADVGSSGDRAEPAFGRGRPPSIRRLAGFEIDVPADRGLAPGPGCDAPQQAGVDLGIAAELLFGVFDVLPLPARLPSMQGPRWRCLDRRRSSGTPSGFSRGTCVCVHGGPRHQPDGTSGRRPSRRHETYRCANADVLVGNVPDASRVSSPRVAERASASGVHARWIRRSPEKRPGSTSEQSLLCIAGRRGDCRIGRVLARLPD